MANKIFQTNNIPKKLISAGEIISFKKNEIIIHPGDMLNNIYILVKGKIIVITNSANGSMVYDLLVVPPSIIGHTHLLNNKEMTATFKCIEDIEVIKISTDNLMNIIKSDFDVFMYLYQISFMLIEKYSFQAREYATFSSEERIVKILIEFAEVLGKEINGKIKIDFKLSHQFISDLVGVTRMTTLHALQKLEKMNIITISAGTYYINDFSALKNIYRI